MDSLFDPVYFTQDTALYASRHTADAPMKGYYHYHAAFELLYVSRGAGKIVVNQRTYDIEPGMLYCFQPFQLHKVHPEASAGTPYERTVLHFDPVAVDRAASPFPELQRFFRQLWKRQLPEQRFDVASERALMEAVCRSFETDRAKGREQSNLLLLLQMISCLRRATEDRSESALSPRELRYSESVMQWIEANFATECSLDALADALHLSKNYVSRVFRQETGNSISEYLTARRIKEACRLLQATDDPVERVGIAVGLPNVSYFCHVFKRVVGVSPLQYRKRS